MTYRLVKAKDSDQCKVQKQMAGVWVTLHTSESVKGARKWARDNGPAHVYEEF